MIARVELSAAQKAVVLRLLKTIFKEAPDHPLIDASQRAMDGFLSNDLADLGDVHALLRIISGAMDAVRKAHRAGVVVDPIESADIALAAGVALFIAAKVKEQGLKLQF